MDTKALVEEKRRKLEELRKRREEAQQDTKGDPDTSENTSIDSKPLKPTIDLERASKTPSRSPSPAPDHDNPTDDTDLRAQIREQVEKELRKEYSAELAARLEKIRADDRRTQERNSEAVLKLLQVSHLKEDAVNTDRDSRYSKPIAFTANAGDYTSSFNATLQTFQYDEHKRPITSIDWSPHYPELVLACYNGTINSTDVPGGAGEGPRSLIVVWNIEDSQKPAFVLYSYTELTIAKFSKRRSNEVVAGASNGRLYLWKFDSPSRYPVVSTQKPGLSVSPVVGIYESSNSYVAVSLKGLVAIHSLNLVSPISEDQLKLPNHSHLYHITACHMDASQLVVGLSTGEVYSIELSKLNDVETVETLRDTPGALLPVTSLDSFQGATLLGSVDYHLRVVGKQSYETFVPYLVCDAKFVSSSTNKLLSVSFDGRLEFWDRQDPKRHKSPIDYIQLNNGDTLNVARYHRQGQLAAGGLDGKLYLFDLKERY